MPLGNLQEVAWLQERVKGGVTAARILMAEERTLPYFFVVAAFFLLNPVSTAAPMLASISFAGCA